MSEIKKFKLKIDKKKLFQSIQSLMAQTFRHCSRAYTEHTVTYLLQSQKTFKYVIISKTYFIQLGYICKRIPAMITQQVIDTLYKQYSKLPKSLDCLDMPLLFDAAGPHHDISVDMDDNMNAELVIGSIDRNSPFHRLPMHRIHAIVPFESWVAIVMHSSIIFLNKKDNKVSIHLKPMKEGVVDRLRRKLSI